MEKLKKTIHQIIAQEIPKNSSVLDLGCGDGVLLNYLKTDKKIKAHGVDISSKAIVKCIEKGIPVIQLDLNSIPLDFSDNSFDTVILNQTLQEILRPDKIIEEMLRIGKVGILGFLNFGTLKIRLKFLFLGKMPVTKELPFHWYNTPNIHLATHKDFIDFCRENNIKIQKSVFLKHKLKRGEKITIYKKVRFMPNIRSDLAIFIINK